MSQIINELAMIEVSDEMLQQLDLGSIFESFRKSGSKLDNLKDFRSAYEEKNWFMRWWDNDKLRDAQLDSAEVQAEFSKTIGQLMIISIVQSKKSCEAQAQLNEQQSKLKAQADGITEQAAELQKQHQVLAEQSAKLEKLVHDYFELKGLTEDGAQKLIDIAKEIKSTKEGMLQDFAARAKGVEVLCGDVMSQMTALSAQINERIRQDVDQIHSKIVDFQEKVRGELVAIQSALVDQQAEMQLAINYSMERLEQGQRGIESRLQDKQVVLAAELSNVSTRLDCQGSMSQERFGEVDNELRNQSRRLMRFGYIAIAAIGLWLPVLAAQFWFKTGILL